LTGVNHYLPYAAHGNSAAHNWSLHMKILKGIPEREYHAWNLMSASALKTLDKSTPLHLLADRENDEDTPAFRIGRALHSLLLTPAAYELDFVTAPDCDRRTKAGKEEFEKFREIAEGRTILTKDEANLVEEMRGGVMSNQSARQLLAACGDNVEITLKGEMFGIPMKARIDGWIENSGTIIDIKSTGGLASPQACAKAAWDFGYWTQFAFYREALRLAGHEVSSVVLIFVEKNPPHACSCVALNPEDLDIADARLVALSDLYRRFMDEPGRGWSEDIVEIRIPAYAKTELLAPTGD
jgi:exodeoxyribonuclease VIII